MASKVQMLDLDSIEGSAPTTRPRHQHKRRRTDDEPPHKRNEPVPNAEFESQLAVTQQKYTRVVGDADSAVTAKSVTDKKIRGMIERADQKYAQAASEAARAEILLPAEQGALVAEGMSRTYKFTQEAIADEVDVQTRRKIFDLNLDQFGPYMMDYSRSGRHLLLAGNKGHIAMLNAHTFRLQTEFHLKETVRDVKFLHNSNMFAVAQKQHAFIYDAMGVELHCLRNHVEPTRLEFLPHHFLLVSASKTGFFKYTDVSTGKLIVELRSKLGPCDTLTQNPRNAIILGGHGNGQVTMWSPNMTTPLVKMQCHRGPVSAIAVDPMGQYMCTAGMDSQVKVWDLRTYRVLQEYYTARPANSLDISQMGLLAAGFGPHVQVWKDAFTTKQKSPYLVHHVYGHEVADVQFCPYEDVLGLSHSEGFGSIVVPGAGEANFDSFATDLFASKKQRQEMEVRQLMDKLQPEMITMDTNVIGSVDRASKEVLKAEKVEDQEAAAAKFLNIKSASASDEVSPELQKKRENRAKKLRRRRANIIDAETKERKTQLLKDKQLEQEQRHQQQLLDAQPRAASATAAPPKSALRRFLQ